MTVAINETDKTIGRLEAKVEYAEKTMLEIKAETKADMAEIKEELKQLNQFLDQARGAKVAIVGMWMLAGVVITAIWTVIENVFKYWKAN